MECHVIVVDELPDGTAEDYALHIVGTVDRLALRWEKQPKHIDGIIIVKTPHLYNQGTCRQLHQHPHMHPEKRQTPPWSLQKKPDDNGLFCEMIKASLMAVVTVLERQYSRYFGLELTDQL